MPSFPLNQDYIIILYSNFLNGFIMAFVGVLIYKISLLFTRKKDIKWYLIPILVSSTNLFVQAHESFAHPTFILFFLCTVYYLLFFYEKKEYKYLTLASLFFTFTASSYNLTFVYLLPSLFLLHILKMRNSSKFSICMTFLMLVIPGLFFQAIWNFMRFNNFFSTGYLIENNTSNTSTFTLNISTIISRLYGLTFAPNKGLFINNPVLIGGYCIALVNFVNKKRQAFFELFTLATSFIYIFMYSLFLAWHGDETYGPRYLSPLIPLVIILIVINFSRLKNRIVKSPIIISLVLGFLIQLPGILIPSFSIVFLSPANCREEVHRYFDWRCAPIKVGWSHLLKRRVKETLATTGNIGKINVISLKYPNPPKPFRTIYPDPLFNAFSKYKTTDYKLDKNMMNDIYSFTLDIWWIKGILYKNIFNK